MKVNPLITPTTVSGRKSKDTTKAKQAVRSSVKSTNQATYAAKHVAKKSKK